MRCSYNQIQQGQTPSSNLTQDRIERLLEEIGFKWKLANVAVTFEQRCRDLEAFKNEIGHCNVPFKYSANPSLGNWCHERRCAYNKIQRGQTPRRNLTQGQIERLEEIGFKWKLGYLLVTGAHVPKQYSSSLLKRELRVLFIH